MPIGKDSITKRVAKIEPNEENIAPELVATTAAAPKAPAKKASTAPKTKAPAAPKKAPAKKPVSPVEEPKVETTVLANVAPETVEAVIGHKEDEKYEKVQIGDALPMFLM